MMDILRKMLNPNDTSVSYGRTMALVITAFVLGWDTCYLVFAWRFNSHLPTGMAPMDLLPSAGTLLAQGGFMTLFYGVTKYGDLNPPQNKP